MQVLLIYNPNAGDGVQPQLRGLVDMIEAAGHEARCRSSKDPRLGAAFSEPCDLVAVAGGDGTVAKIARLSRGRATPIAPLPVGTANNIATALGLAGMALRDQIVGWSDGEAVAIDVGKVRRSRRSRAFLESFGLGLIPHLMAEEAPDGHSAEQMLAHAVARARRAAHRLPAIELKAALDGRDLSGRYLVLEAMNIGWVGPNLNLAPSADPADGRLDVVLVREEERPLLIDCLLAVERGALPEPLPTMRGNVLSIEQGGFAVHVDDELWEGPVSGSAGIDVTLRDSVRFLIPRRKTATRATTPGDAARNAARTEPAEREQPTRARLSSPAGRRARLRR